MESKLHAARGGGHSGVRTIVSTDPATHTAREETGHRIIRSRIFNNLHTLSKILDKKVYQKPLTKRKIFLTPVPKGGKTLGRTHCWDGRKSLESWPACAGYGYRAMSKGERKKPAKAQENRSAPARLREPLDKPAALLREWDLVVDDLALTPKKSGLHYHWEIRENIFPSAGLDNGRGGIADTLKQKFLFGQKERAVPLRDSGAVVKLHPTL